MNAPDTRGAGSSMWGGGFGGRNRSAAPASYQFDKLARDLYRMGPVQRRIMRQKFAALGAPLLADARRRAGWSSQIPDAISVTPYTDMTRGRAGLVLRVSRKVPHARAYEGISQQGSLAHFRHPVYGNRQAWVSQKTRPYAAPAVRVHESKLRRAVEETVDQAARECGFR